MKVIDDNGRLFGVVNAIDAVGIVLVIALIISVGAIFIAPSSTSGGVQKSANGSGNASETKTPMMNRTTSVVRFQLTNDAPYIVDGIDKGAVPNNEHIVSVLDSSRTTPVSTGTNNTTSNASLRLRVNVTIEDSDVQFQDERLYIGNEFRLDLGDVVVDAVVTDFEVNYQTTVAEENTNMTGTSALLD
ncbi:DUF4330 domain-containing protein [Halococcus dombrowskii]|uniref:DUF4330 domain-containing protein n=1 Tax=Halococcus dombrowskii TaxID=179637 RepID=A0AAV3SJ90_HALDO|nr:DUF4330 family protein [Halococcus dombrowskii]UOO94987.1 DUF4330 domain-containing protein [Halococcus dombrowskii]